MCRSDLAGEMGRQGSRGQTGGGDRRTRGIKLNIGGARFQGEPTKSQGPEGCRGEHTYGPLNGTLPGVAWQDMHRLNSR